jgi:hypothetical protein
MGYLLAPAVALVVAMSPGGDIPGVPVKVPSGAAAEAQTDAWMVTVKDHAEDGDWLVVRGSHVGDQLVAAATLGRLTHAVVLDKQRQEVVEAVATGVVVTPLRRLLAQAHRLQIVRPPDWTREAGLAAVARARSRVGAGYDWTGLVGLQRDTRFYCTELAVDAYRGRERGWKIARLITPESMAGIGRLVFDSGPRGASAPVLAAGRAAAAPVAPAGRFAKRLLDARGVAYAAEVAPGLFRGGTPNAEGVAWLKSLGVKTVINLRHYHGNTEGKQVEAAGMRYQRIKLESSDAPSTRDVRRFLAMVKDPALRPIYVHCLHGVDRTGTMMAVYRMEVDGWSNEEAFAEMEHFGAHKVWRDLRAYVRAYRPDRATTTTRAPPPPP